MSEKHYFQEDILAMEKRYRTHFINSLSGYKSANLIGTIDHKSNTNLNIVSSVVHLGANPALIGFVNRPHSVERNTLDNIYNNGCYTINHVAIDSFEDAHHTSARYPSNISEFDMTAFTEQYSSIKAPYVKQSSIKIGLEFKQKIDIELNGTVFIIGEIIEVILDEEIVGYDGKLNLVSAQSTCVSGLDEYHQTTSLGRLAYAKPKIP